MKTKLILDVYKTECAQLNYFVTGRVGDMASNSVDVYIVDGGGNAYSLTNLTIFYECTKPDNTVIRDSTGVNIIDATAGHFEYTFPKETFSIPGRSKRAFFAIEKDKVIRATTQDFIVVSIPNALDGNIQSEQYISDLEKLIADGNKMLSGLNSQSAAMQTKINDLNKQISTMDVVKKSGDTMTGALTSTADIPFISKKASKKSWTFHHPNTDEFILAPSLSTDGTDWDWSHGIKFTPNGTILLNGSEVATQAQYKQKSQITSDDGSNIDLQKGIDLNTVLNAGFYRANTSVNTPIVTGDNWWFIEIQKHFNTWVMQRATLFNNSNQETYERFCYNGTWQSWKKTVNPNGWGSWRTDGQDLKVWGKRALVGYATDAGDLLTINHSNDFKNGVNVLGPLKNNNVDVLTKSPKDTAGWIDLTLLNGANNNGGKPNKYRVHNEVVYITGSVAGLKDGMIFANMPAGIRPPYDARFPINFLSGLNLYTGLLSVLANGDVRMDWTRNDITSFDFYISYHL
ncbi:BppU family phage baseplate upper protein [Bacillus sp. BP-3]|uniref:BppU family phage baseplate upper protein n=1 Tax=Bacillus sp. BP-3 TaxID=3022773 RepID=UPI00232C99BB|nr:BppU family phage baseplate upper protein [Bacillus sp. BP-3]MDC2863793.1 BppU family phage baseplate upper protein [Bacillus sp. BP-3]